MSGRKVPSPFGSIHRVPAVPPRYRFQCAGSRTVLRPSTSAPFRPKLIALAGPQGTCFDNWPGPALTLTSLSQYSRLNGRPTDVEYTTRWLSVVQPATAHAGPLPSKVSRR